MSVENPFFHRGPVRSPLYFYGRSQEVTSVLTLIKNNQSVSIVGPRRIGKTSLLLHISHREVMVRHGLAPDSQVFVFIDCGGLSDLKQSDFYRLILEETEDQLRAQGLGIELRIPDTPSYRQFERTLRRLSQQGLKMIYILDEFELLSENSNLDTDFFSGLRGLTSRLNICYVTASQANLLKLSYADEAVLGSPFFNIFAVQHLNLFSRSEALQLIHGSTNPTHPAFPEETINYLLDLVGTHPLFLNIGCFHMLAQSNGDLSTGITKTAMPEIEQRILAEIEGHLHYYWSKLDSRERETLAAVDRGGGSDTTQVFLNRLEQQGLVIRVAGSYRYRSRTLAEFVYRRANEETSAGFVSESTRSMIGTRLGQYHITGPVGQGGMAQVYKGHHEALDRDVAIKIISSTLAHDKDFLARFHREAQAVAALRHPNIVQVYDFGIQDTLYYMVMEYVTGGTLQERLVERQRRDGYALSLTETTHLIQQVTAALDYAHAKGIIHRDLKPANIMLTADDQVVLADFGLARLMDNTRHTATGTSWGTPAYMSSEQARGERVDTRSDIYSVGVILYELLTGQIPFEADTPFGLMMMHMNQLPPSPQTKNPQLSEVVAQVVLKSLAKAPESRYQTAGELAQALNPALFTSE